MDLHLSEHREMLARRLMELRQGLGPPLAAATADASGKAGAAFENARLFAAVVQQALSGILSLLNDLSQKTVSREHIFKKYRRLGHAVFACEDIGQLEASTVDGLVKGLEARYAAVAAVEGGVTGGLSILGPAALAACIAADATALIALNLRAVGEFATYYGFDIDLPQERLYALNVLLLASSWSDTSKELVLAELAAIARQTAAKKTWAELEKHIAVLAARRIAKRLSIDLTKAKLAQVVPVVSIVVGSGFNAYYTRKVCQEAPRLYRQRFLLAKGGLES